MALTRLRAVTAHFLRLPHSAPATTRSACLATAAGQGTVHNDNAGCCSVPAASSSYQPRGSFISYAGFDRVYAVGPARSSLAIICIYDIFGFKPQTQLGADILSAALNARVVMPDFFEPGDAWDTSRHPPKTKEDQQAFQAFFAGPAKPSDAVEKLERVALALRNDGAKRVGAYGLCWGGKVAALAGGKASTPLDAIGTAHPAMLKADDTIPLHIPLAIYVSKDEPQDEYKRILSIIETKLFAKKCDSLFYETMFHGWAGARANFDDPENKRLFEDVYGRFERFFRQNLSEA